MRGIYRRQKGDESKFIHISVGAFVTTIIYHNVIIQEYHYIAKLHPWALINKS